ncbi:MAG: FecR domain-containing protein [Phycisphaerales bacterium]
MFAQMRVVSNAAFASAVVLATLAGSSLALGQQGQTTQSAKADEKPAATTAAAPAAAKTTITCIAVKGGVAFKADPDAGLAELKAGQVLSEMSEIMTTPDGLVQIKIGEGQVFTIDKNSRVLIKDAIKPASGKETTTLQVPYGRVRFDITSTKVANDVKIQTPDATLAVKGTHGVIEKLPGQRTRAYGGELNAGIFNVMYTTGVKVDVSKDKKTTGDSPLVAATADKASFVKSKLSATGDDTNRNGAGWTPSEGSMSESDERAMDGQNSQNFLPHHSANNPLAGDVAVGIDPNLGTVITITRANGTVSVAGSGISGFLGTVEGAALVNTAYGPYLVAIDSEAGPNYKDGTLAFRFWNPGDRTWTMLGSVSALDVWVPDEDGGGHFVRSAYNLDGLGNLNGSLYASGVNPVASQDPNQTTGNWGVFAVTGPAQQRGEMSLRQVMSFPMLRAGGGLTGANSRGTMFAAARFNQMDGSPGLVLLEIDPRINYIVNAWSAVEGDFTSAGGHGPALPGGFEATGVAFSGGNVVLTGNASGHSATVTIRPGAESRPTARVISTRVGGTPSRDMAGEGGFNASSPIPLAAADRNLPRISGIDPLWLATSYSRVSGNNRTFRRMMTDTIFAHTPSARAFADSPEFNTVLANAIADHYNQVDGVNSALSQFYNSILWQNGNVSGVSALPVGRGGGSGR